MKHTIPALVRIVWIGVLMLNTVSVASARGDVAYQTGFVRWRAVDNEFASWSREGTKLNSGTLELDPATAAPGTDPYPAEGYNGGNYYNGGSFKVGEATSPEIATAFSYKEAIASWNASTPPVHGWKFSSAPNTENVGASGTCSASGHRTTLRSDVILSDCRATQTDLWP